MGLPPLFRQKLVRRPTFAGWLVLCVCAGLLGLFAVRSLYPFLAQNDPLPNARYLVVEGWLYPSELDQAIARFQSGHYERLVTTGGPVMEWGRLLGESDYAGVAARYLTTHGLLADRVVAVPAPPTVQDRTYLSAVKLREWLAAQGIGPVQLDLMSAGAHARRSHATFRMALGPTAEIGILAAIPADYPIDGWWRTSSGVKTVGGEALSLLWVNCCFFPPEPGLPEGR